MIRVQIVCKNTTESKVRQALAELGAADKLRPRKGHLIVELASTDPSVRIVEVCRRHAYAYLRLVEWERGGGLEGSGDATCVAGINGQPLRPIALTLKSERANQDHALFGSRNGLVVVNARRQGRVFDVHVTKHTIRDLAVAEPEVLLDERFICSSREWLDSGQMIKQVCMDQFIPVVRSALRKAECLFCAHCHYREVEDRPKESS